VPDAVIRIKRGLDLPLAGAPQPRIESPSSAVRHVALLGGDYPGMRPTLAVAEGDRVRRGQVLFEDKKTRACATPHPAPASWWPFTAASGASCWRWRSASKARTAPTPTSASSAFDRAQLPGLDREQVQAAPDRRRRVAGASAHAPSARCRRRAARRRRSS
jgi:hypothetical protein